MRNKTGNSVVDQCADLFLSWNFVANSKVIVRIRNKTGNSMVDLVTVYCLKNHRTVKLLRNRIDNSLLNLTIVWTQSLH